MKSFLSPGNPILFDVEGRYKSSTYNHMERFAPIWSSSDLVFAMFPEQAGAGTQLTVQGQTDFSPFAIKTSATPTFNFTDPQKTYGISMFSFQGLVRFQYTHPSGPIYFSPTYYVTNVECELARTIQIRYWNGGEAGENGFLYGGAAYPDIDYTSGQKLVIRVYGSLDYDTNISNRTNPINSLGISSVCRADNVPVYKLTVGPSPAWLHEKLAVIFTHQNIEVKGHNSNDWVRVVPYGQNPYVKTEQIGTSYDLWNGEATVTLQEHGILTA